MICAMMIGLAPARALGQCSPQDLAKLIASDAAAGDTFGVSVAVAGDTAVIGAWDNDHAGGIDAGAAYVFVRSGLPGKEVWTQQAKLTASDAAATDSFGVSVDVSGDTALIGAYLDDHSGWTDAGSAYVFVRSGPPGSEVWTQQAKLVASDPGAFDRFGVSVALAGDTALIGAHFDNNAGGTDAGSAYVFVRTGPPGNETWTQQAKLTASDAAAADKLGGSVALSINTAVVGAYFDDHAGGIDSGSAYVFVRSGIVWIEQAKLTASDAAASDAFGVSVAVSGETALVGAHLNDHAGEFNPGSAYVFVRSGTPGNEVWTQQAKLSASDAAGGDEFGKSVAVSGDTAVVGASEDDDAGTLSGSAYVFVRSGPPGSKVWTQQVKLTAFDAAAFDEFGFSVALAGDTAIVGARYDDHEIATNTGSAYLFDLNCLPASPADINGDGAVNVDDLLAVINAWGPCPTPCAADANQDGVVNVDDLLLVINDWG